MLASAIMPEQPYAQSRPEESPSWKIFHGDSREVLLQLPAESIDCVVTSPPYYWQRDYGVEGQLGMEPDIQGFVKNLVTVFKGVRHALKPRGVLFLNLGDTYYNKKGRPHGRDGKHAGRHLARQQLRAVERPGLGLPRKSLLGMPWRTALAMAEDGWTLRSEIIWRRKSAMPEPTALDRPWRQHEHIFLFSKEARYDFDRAGLDGEEDVWDIEPERNSATRGAHLRPLPQGSSRAVPGSRLPRGGHGARPVCGRRDHA